MKRTALLVCGFLLLLAAACVKEETGPAVPSGKMVTIRVAVPEEAYSKMSFTEEDGKLKTAWEDTDCIRIISGNQSEVFTISNIVSDHVAEFTGPAVSGSSFDILYPGTYASIDEVVADAASPEQTGNGSTAHLRFRALLEGVDAYQEIAFKNDWAQAHGGTLKQGAAVKLVATLPAGVTTVTKAGIILGGVNYTVPLSGVDVSASAQKLTAFMMLPWEDIPLPNGSEITVYAMDPDKEAYGFQIPISGGDKTVTQGKMNSFGGHATVLTLSLQDFVAGDGTQENPYLIANARQLNNMHNVMVNNSSNWFRLLEDIDASSITNWVPLNTASGFSKAMDFDGDGHTISKLTSTGASYASFCGVLNGHIHDVTFDNATISHNSKIGVVGGFIGTTGVVGNCTDVHVKNSTVNGQNQWVGGFAGEINTTGTLLRCSVENTTATCKSHVGEFAGMVRGQVATIKDCYTTNFTLAHDTTPSATQGLGGFIGCTTINAVFDHCHVDGPVTLSSNVTPSGDAKIAVGGFIGYSTPSAPPEFTDCYVEGPSVSISGKAEVGGFVGNSDKSASYTRCYVKGATVSGVYHLGGFLGYGQISSGYEVPAIFTDCSVENVKVTQNLASASGSIHTGGFAGNVNQALSFIGCSVKGTAVSATKAAVQNVGGFVGCTTYAGSNYQNCTVDGASSVTANANSVGGFVGWAFVPDAYKDCSSAATVKNSGAYTGGFVGYAQASSAFTSCCATGNVESSGAYCGGFVGRAEVASFTSCHYDNGTVKDTRSNNNTQVGGFVGGAIESTSFNGCYVSSATITASSSGRTGGFAGQLGGSSGGGNNVKTEQCYVTGTNVDGAINSGGFVGVQYESTDRCYVSGGTVTAHGNDCGGFSAFVQNGNITNCYTTASVVGGSYSPVGGFLGIAYTTTVSNCYSSGAISGSGSSVGAFVGQCTRQGTQAVADISSSIGWHASLPFCAVNAVGATITNCYAGTSGSVSAQAQAQNWPAAVWDLSGSLPVLTPGSTRIKAVFVGDSITWQWARVSRKDAQQTIIDATHGALGNTPLPSYMTLSNGNITTTFHPGFFSGNGYIDKGISGQNTTQMRARFEKDVLALNPRVFVIMGGTNDIAQGVSEATIYDNIAYMAATAKAAGIKVVVCSITPNNREYSVGWKSVFIESLNGQFQNLCTQEGYSWCDYWTALVANDDTEAAVATDIGHGLKDAYKLYDDLHPGPAAYTVMEGIVKPIIDGLLNN